MAIRHFDLFFILTEGGPGDASHVVAWRIYVETFRNLSFGTGAAMAYILALATLALAYAIIRALAPKDLRWRSSAPRPHQLKSAITGRIPGLGASARGLALAVASLLFLGYVLAPIAWLVSSSFQSEHEIISKPPHWIPQRADRCRTSPRSSRRATRPSPTRRGRPAIPPAAASFRRPRGTCCRRCSTASSSPAPWWRSICWSGVPAAYAMAKIRFRGRQASIYAILATRVIPDIALVVPFFLFIRNLGLLDNIWSLIITYLAITVPFSVFVLVSYFESLPDELDKAARVDGCSRLQTLTRVYLPLALPSLVAVILFAFLASWNEFLLALMFTQTTGVADPADRRGVVHLRLHDQLFVHQRRRRAGDHAAGAFWRCCSSATSCPA